MAGTQGLAKLEARQERSVLMTEYGVKVAALGGTSAELEVILFSSRKTVVGLQIMLKDVTEQKEREALKTH
jgi:hypothetical protein